MCVRRPLFGALCALLLSACAGPNFHRPEAPEVAGYAPTQLPEQTSAASGVAGGESQSLKPSADVIWQWWTLYDSPALNELIEQSFRHNPSITSAQAALRQAQELVAAQRGFFYPSIAANYTFERQKVAGNLSNSVAPGVQGNGTAIEPLQNAAASPHNEPLYYNFHTAELSVGYTPDVFGSNWRQVESLQAQAEAERYLLEAAYMTLAADVVAAAVQEASVREQLDSAHSLVQLNEHVLQILQRQFTDGYVMRADVAAQEAQLAQAQALIPPLQNQLDQTQDLLRALVGNMPDRDVTASFCFKQLHLPRELPVSVPSKLIDQRPDVRQAEALLHSANAQLGVAVAARLPQFSITGDIGGTATELSQMFRPGGPFWDLILGMSQPIFQGGTLMHRQRAAKQALIQAAAQYQMTVLAAYQNVADSLHAIYNDADGLQAAVKNEQATRVMLEIAQRQLQTGYISEQVLLQAEMAYQQALMSRIQAQAMRFGDTAALFVALGGGWWNRPASVGG